MYYHSTIADQNSNLTELWKFIKTVILSKSSASSNLTKLIVDDRAVENANEITHAFNNCVVEIGSSIAQSNWHSNEVNFKTFLKKMSHKRLFLILLNQ